MEQTEAFFHYIVNEWILRPPSTLNQSTPAGFSSSKMRMGRRGWGFASLMAQWSHFSWTHTHTHTYIKLSVGCPSYSAQRELMLSTGLRKDTEYLLFLLLHFVLFFVPVIMKRGWEASESPCMCIFQRVCRSLPGWRWGVMTGRLAGTQNFSLCQRTPSFALWPNWPLLARAKLTTTRWSERKRRSKREKGGMEGETKRASFLFLDQDVLAAGSTPPREARTSRLGWLRTEWLFMGRVYKPWCILDHACCV